MPNIPIPPPLWQYHFFFISLEPDSGGWHDYSSDLFIFLNVMLIHDKGEHGSSQITFLYYLEIAMHSCER